MKKNSKNCILCHFEAFFSHTLFLLGIATQRAQKQVEFLGSVIRDAR